MPEQKTIQFTAEAQAILRDLRENAWMIDAVAVGMDRANQLTMAHIMRQHLTGRGPFPVQEHKLGVVTGRLRAALWAAEATVRGTQVETGIGDNVSYAAIHEFGGKIKHPARSGSVRLRTDRLGNLLKQSGNEHLLVFAKASHKRAKTVAFTSEAYEVEMPARAPIQTGIEEKLEDYGEWVSDEVVFQWGQRQR